MTSCRKARVASIGHATSKCEAFCLFWPILVQCLRLLGPQNGRETVFPMFSHVSTEIPTSLRRRGGLGQRPA